MAKFMENKGWLGGLGEQTFLISKLINEKNTCSVNNPF